MGYLYLLAVALMFSFGGSCVKTIRPCFTPPMITLLRFSVGVGWLLLLKAVRRQRFRADFAGNCRRCWRLLLLGAVSKWGAYLLENTALSIGVSYGNILTQPVQMVLLAVLGAVALHEALDGGKRAGVALCVVGILLISWNGLSLSEFLGDNLALTLMYVVSGCCAGLFVFAQKKLAGDFDGLDSNLVMFAAAALLSLVQPAAQGQLAPQAPIGARCAAAILFYGFITGIGFYLNALAIPLVPFYMVPLLQSTMVFFSILWGILFFHERVSVWIVCGALLYVAGLLVMQGRHLPVRQGRQKQGGNSFES